MTDDHKRKPEGLEELRSRAERILQRLAPDQDPATLSAKELGTIVYELQVHQTELEMQNEELRNAQHALAQARDKYADLYEFAPLGYFTLDRNGVILDVNVRGAHMVGREKRVLIKKPFITLIPSDDHATFYTHLKGVFGGLEKQTCEIRLAVQGHNNIIVMLESQAVLGINGEVEFCRTAMADVSEIKRLQEEVFKTQEQVLSSMTEGVSVADENGFVAYTNHSFDAMFGCKPQELVGKNLADLGDCLDYEFSRGLREIIGQLVAKRVWRGEFRCSKQDGTFFDARVRATYLKRLGNRNLVFVWEDITAFKLAQEALSESEQRFRTIFEGTTDLIFIKNRNCKYTHVNLAFEQFLATPVAKIVGRTYEELFGEQGATYENDVDTRVLNGETIEEEFARTVNRTRRRFHEVRIPLKDTQGNVVGICGIARDVTERVEKLLPPRREPEAYPSNAMKAVVHLASRAARTDSVILLRGETGTGKDYLARYIHDHSNRAGGPFYSINCGAVPDSLAESELFGHERGAFTGSHARKRGLLELAEGGTLLLNEIGELPLALQSKLLTFMDTRQIVRIGGEKSISVNARLIAATNRDLDAEVGAGRFRQDLLYRVTVMVIEVPPLRERLEDLPELVDEITAHLRNDLQFTDPPKIFPSTLQTFRNYPWPGNVRELRNVIERALILGTEPEVQYQAVITTSRSNDYTLTVNFRPGRTLRDITDEVTHALVLEALRRSEGNKKKASRMLGIARDSLYRHLSQFEGSSDHSAE
jgi:PAS domain S-box-containing protein